VLAFTKPKIVFLDDDPSLLETLLYYFKEEFKDTVLINGFSQSQQFLKYVQNSCYLTDTFSEIISHFYNQKPDQKHVCKTLHDLSELCGIIVLDQELRAEKTNGIELSAKIREYIPNTYIALLTSNITNNQAIALHNNHNIDLFIDKKDDDAIVKLHGYLSHQIHRLINEYTTDSMDYFSDVSVLESKDYLLAKDNLLNNFKPQTFLTVNAQGDIALLTDHVSYWQFNSKLNDFIKYE